MGGEKEWNERKGRGGGGEEKEEEYVREMELGLYLDASLALRTRVGIKDYESTGILDDMGIPANP